MTFSGGVKSCFITDIRYVRSWEREFTRVTAGLFCDGTFRGQKRQEQKWGRAEGSQTSCAFVPWEQGAKLVTGVCVGFKQYDCPGNEGGIATQRTGFSDQ